MKYKHVPLEIQASSEDDDTPTITIFVEDKTTKRLVAQQLDPDDYFENYEPRFRAAEEARRQTANDNPPKSKAKSDRKDKRERKILSSGEWVQSWTPPDFLISGLFQRRYIYTITAPAGSGKTAIALTLAAHVAKGRKLGDYIVRQGRVLYLAGENPDDILTRWMVASEHMSFNSATIPVDFFPGLDDIAAIKRYAATRGPYALVIVDTSQAYFDGDDFNANEAQRDWAQKLRTLIEGLPGQPCVIVAAHPPKHASAPYQPYGGNAFLNEIDGNTYLNKSDTIVSLTRDPVKFRGSQFEPLPFQLQSVMSDQLIDANGTPVFGIIAVPMAAEDYAAHKAARMPSEADTELMALIDAEPRQSIQAYADKLGVEKRKAQTRLDKLVRGGFVAKDNGKPYLTVRGQDALVTSKQTGADRQ